MFACLAVFARSSVAAVDPDKLLGDATQIAVPLAGLAMTYVRDDPEGRSQWIKSTLTTFLATETLKYSLNGTALGPRPNGGDHSFPSGHTSAACGGSFFMAQRYGWESGVVGLAAALATGYSRVDEGYHHWRDVIAGCALGYASVRYFVTPAGSPIVITPQVAPRQLGLRVDLKF